MLELNDTNASEPKKEIEMSQQVWEHLQQQITNRKKKFPIITMPLLDEAISQDYLPYDERDKLLRDPNKLTLLHVKLDPGSPNTREALQHLQLDSNACFPLQFEQFQQNDPPVKTLINYMRYLGEKYKELLRIVTMRNKLKKQKKLMQKHAKSDSVHVSQALSTISQLFITDSHTKAPSILSKSMNTKSMEFLYTSVDDKLEQQKQRHQKYIKTIAQHIHQEEIQLKTLNDYYQQHIPIREQKVKAVQEANLKKLKQHKLKYNQRSQKTMHNIQKLEMLDLNKRTQIRRELQKKIENQEANMSDLESKQMLEIQLQQEKALEKELIRKEKQLKAIQLEENTIQSIMEKHQFKEEKTEELIRHLKDEQANKRALNETLQDKAQQRVNYTLEIQEKKKLQQFIRSNEVSTRMVEESLKAKQQELEQLKVKSKAQWTKVQHNKTKMHKMFNARIEQLRNKDDKDVILRLEQIQQGIEQKLQEQAQKHQNRLIQAQHNTQVMAEQIQAQQSKILNKIVEQNKKSKQYKLDQEKYKSGTLRQHLLMRQKVDQLYNDG